VSNRGRATHPPPKSGRRGKVNRGRSAYREKGLSGPDSRHRVPRPLLGALLMAVLAITLAAYVGAFGHEFLTWDDPDYVVQNSLVLTHDYGGLLKAIVSSNYHPLTMVSLALNAAVPVSAKPFLVTNALLHTMNAGLVFWFAFLLSGRRLFVAFWTALFFGIHPMHVESVAWISERKDLLYTAFFLGGALAYWRYLRTSDLTWLAVTFALFVLSCLSKAMAVVFPLVMVLLDMWARRPALSGRSLLEKAPFLVTSLLFGLIALNVQGGGDFHGLLTRTDLHLKGLADSLPFPAWQRAIMPAYGFMGYIWKLFVPTGLSAFYPYPSPAEAGGPLYLIAPLFLVAVVALAMWDFRRTRILTFGIGWFLITIALVLQWIPVGEAIMADRYTYLSYVGPLFALAMGASALAGRSRGWWVACFAVLGLLGALFFVLTTRQVAVWRNSETLWTNVVRRFPHSGTGYVVRGNARGASGHVQEAMQDLLMARSLGSRRVDLYDGLGNSFAAQGQLDSAVVMFSTGLALAPNAGRTYYNRALAYVRLGRPREALADLDQAQKLMSVQTVNVHLPKGDAYLQLQQFREAAAEYDQAIQAGARDPVAYNNRAIARWNLGDQAGASADLEEARRLNNQR
jgi:hypothetical protein